MVLTTLLHKYSCTYAYDRGVYKTTPEMRTCLFTTTDSHRQCPDNNYMTVSKATTLSVLSHT